MLNICTLPRINSPMLQRSKGLPLTIFLTFSKSHQHDTSGIQNPAWNYQH
jgi:hypothetical protein